jgi:hypothetical protein
MLRSSKGSWRKTSVGLVASVSLLAGGAAARAACDDACLTQIADQYRAAYVHRDAKQAPFAGHVRFMENNVEMPFPEGSWDVVTSEVGPSMTFSDPSTGSVGVYTAVMMGNTPAFLAIRLRVEHDRIVEVEHLLSTKRLISAPPTPFGDVTKLTHDPLTRQLLTPTQRRPRAELIRIADGYFATLSHNDGTLHTQFAPFCHRIENGMETAPNGCEGPFKLGTYLFNVRVRREPLLVDEARGLVMFRGFIDHKGNVIDFKLTDGTPRTSPFQEPHTWSFVETFKIIDGAVGPVEADFIGSPYYSKSPWSQKSHE